ncbi:MAG: hypothetical protein Sapg2KO_29380 [Saprospiraceae bacterium]
MPIKYSFLLFCILFSLNGVAQEYRLTPPTETPAYADLSSPVNAVAFSPDGQWLLIGTSNASTLLMNIEDRRAIKLVGHQARINAVAFSPDSQFILTGSEDKSAKLWDLKGKELRAFPTVEAVYSVAFSPNWSQDSLFITGSWQETQVWNIRGSTVRIFKEGNNRIYKLLFGSDYKIFSIGKTSSGPGRDSHLGNRANTSTSTLFSLAPDGRSFLSGSIENISLWELNKPSNLPQKYEAIDPTRNSNQIVLKDLNGSVRSIFNIEAPPQYVLSYTPDGQGFLVGVGNDIVHYNLQGQKLRAYTGHYKPARCIAFTPDGRHFVTGSGDNTVKVWSLGNPRAVATIAYLNSKEWAVFEPNGLFDASSRAMSDLKYNCSYGDENFNIELSQLKQRYYEPGLLATLLGQSSATFRAVPNIQTIKLFPKITAEELNYGMKLKLEPRNGGIGKISIYINNFEVEEDANPDRLNELIVSFSPYRRYFNSLRGGRNEITIRVYNEEGWLMSNPITTTYELPSEYTSGSNRGPKPKMHVLSIGTSDYEGTNLDLAFADQDARSMAMALSSAGNRLFSEARGTETYCMTTAIRDSFQMAKSNIKWRFANKKEIQTRFAVLENTAKAEDIIVIFLAGHGLSRNEQDRSRFYYLNQGINSEDMINDPDLRAKYTISSDELTKWMGKIPALKKILIIDACNSGQMIEDISGVQSRSVDAAQIRAFDRMKDRAGMYVLSGSADNKASYEAAEFGHGLLTYALLSGMRGPATKKGSGGEQLIDVMNLFQYAADEVPVLANRIKGIQTPILGVPSNASSFDIGLVDEMVDIPIATNKPVIQRSTFMNKNTFNDPLNLTEELELLFLKENSKGKQGNFVFIDTNNYPKAYRLGGLYEMLDDQIKIQLKLSKDGTFVADLNIPPSKNVKVLSKLIDRAVRNYLDSLE